MLDDRLLATGLAGLAGTLADAAIHWAGVLLGLGELHTVTGYYLAQIIFASPQANTAQLITGELAHIIAGGAIGAVVLLLLRLSGRDYALVKGAAIGAVLWLNHVIVVPSLVATRVRIVRGPVEIAIDLAALVVYGIVAAAVIVRLIPTLPRHS